MILFEYYCNIIEKFVAFLCLYENNLMKITIIPMPSKPRFRNRRFRGSEKGESEPNRGTVFHGPVPNWNLTVSVRGLVLNREPRFGSGSEPLCVLFFNFYF